jgi:ABC-type multidrug transport system ATPase subunit
MNIELIGVTKRYGSVAALDRVRLDFAPGQIIALLGPNGAGKSTLLRCLAGIAAPDAGEIHFDGQPFRRDNLELRKRLYFMPDFPPLLPTENVARNLGLILKLYGKDQPGVEERVISLLKDFDLLPLVQTLAATLSRGQAYKLALVAGLAVQPELWLLDEPFASGMDPHGLTQFRRHAREAAARGATVIYTTQLLELAEKFSDRVGVIHEGEVKAFDTIAGLQTRLGQQGGVLETLLNQLREAKV